MTRSIISVLLIVGILYSCGQGSSAKPSCSNPVGTWRNISVSGSEMVIEKYDANTGQITGKYRTGTGAAGFYPLVGWINSAAPAPKGDNASVISFTVRWNALGAITSWTGTCKGDTIKTIWNLASANASYDWGHIQTGSDVFLPQ